MEEYESPIEKVVKEVMKQDEEHLMYSVEQSIGYAIDKEELIKALQYDRKQYERGYEDGRKSRWILCSERLPEEYLRVLIKHNDKSIDVSVGYLMGSKEWYIDSGGYSKFDRVIAWMPLPEPPEGAKSDEY